jgi:GT2 family glycosyltransferase
VARVNEVAHGCCPSESDARWPDRIAGNDGMVPLVYVVILTFNGKELLESCLPSVLQTEYLNQQILVVDNASIDGSSDYVLANHPTVKVIQNSKNFGYAGGNNIGIRVALKAGAKYVVLLNDDTEILDPRWLAEAVRVAEMDREIGVIGFHLLKDRVNHKRVDDFRCRDVVRVDGCSVLLRCDMLSAVGLFDESYFMYCEEDDLECRVRMAGYKIVEVNVPIFHIEGGTANKYPHRMAYLQMRNSIRHAIKNRGAIGTVRTLVRIADAACNPHPIWFDRSNVLHRRLRNSGNVLVNVLLYTRAITWNLKFLPQTIQAKRRHARRALLARARLRRGTRD